MKMENKDCGDKHCAVHRRISARGRTFIGKVVSDKMAKTVNVEWSYKFPVPKYERHEQRRTRVKAHNPACIDAKKGDVVEIGESRPISKTKKFIVLRKINPEEKEEK